MEHDRLQTHQVFCPQGVPRPGGVRLERTGPAVQGGAKLLHGALQRTHPHEGEVVFYNALHPRRLRRMPARDLPRPATRASHALQIFGRVVYDVAARVTPVPWCARVENELVLPSVDKALVMTDTHAECPYGMALR